MQRNLAGELQVNRNSSYEIKAVSAEAVTVPAGAAGTVVVAQLENFPVRNAAGNDIGGDGDTSLALTGGSVPFTNEVAHGTPDASLSNGDFWVDYIRGQIRGKKATTATSATAAYKIAIQNISLDEVEVTVNVDGTDLASGAKQDTGNASLANIETSVDDLLNGQTKTATKSNVTVAATSGEVLAANASRKTGTIITNVSTAGQIISLAIDEAAVLYSGYTLYPGGFWQMDEHDFTAGQIRGIASAAGGSLSIMELT